MGSFSRGKPWLASAGAEAQRERTGPLLQQRAQRVEPRRDEVQAACDSSVPTCGAIPGHATTELDVKSDSLDNSEPLPSSIQECELIYQGEEHILGATNMVYESQESVYEGEVVLAEQADNTEESSPSVDDKATEHQWELIDNFLLTSSLSMVSSAYKRDLTKASFVPSSVITTSTPCSRCPNLHYFSLPSTCMTYDQFCKEIGGLHSLKGMAVDESLINYDVCLHVHQCCPDFVELEIPSADMSSAAIIKFLDCLEELEHLDISGYETSAISRSVLEKASRLKVLLWNSKFELGEFMDCSNCGEPYINPQEPCKSMMEHKHFCVLLKL